MNRFAPLLLVVVAIVALAWWRSGPVATPEVFDHRGFTELEQVAKTEHKWLIVKATASWCPPCKEMDRTTFVDGEVVAWLKSSAIAAHVDIDERGDLAEAWGVEGVPTTIAFRDGVEVARTEGYLAPGPFLGWLKALKAPTAAAGPAKPD